MEMLWMAWARPLLRPSLATAVVRLSLENGGRGAADARDDRYMIRTWRAESGAEGNTPCVKYLE